MDRANFPEFYKKNLGLIRTAAKRVSARALAIGSGTLDYDELEAELTEVFIRAYDGYDPSEFRFSTYFMRAAFNRANYLIKKQEVERINNGTRSVEELGARFDDNDGLSMTVEDVTTISPEEQAQLMSLMRSWSNQLSEIAQTILALTMEPPEWLIEEFHAQSAHIEFAREAFGITKRCRLEINASYVTLVFKTLQPENAALFERSLDEIKQIARNTL